MQLDRKKLDRILQMNDERLADLVRAIAAESGIDPAMLGLNPENIQSIRQALATATDEDLTKLNRVYTDYRQGKHEG